MGGRGGRHSSSVSSGAQIGAFEVSPLASLMHENTGRPISTPSAMVHIIAPEIRSRVFMMWECVGEFVCISAIT